MKNSNTLSKRLRSVSYILIADDDLDDQELIRDALVENELSEDKLRFVADGEELLDALSEVKILPSMILLDLNMPRMGGREVLSHIKLNDRLKHIPVIMFTTSDSEVEIRQCYTLGSNAYMTKPAHYSDLVEAMRVLTQYWLGQARIVMD
ncbi:MAG TPA: response regulator [Marinagarivorans sp.]